MVGHQVPFVEIFFPCLNVANFHNKCAKLYESSQDGSIFDRLLVYGAMSSLCSELSGITNGEESERYHFFSRSFSQHVLKTINVMPAIMTASCEGIEALLTAVCHVHLVISSFANNLIRHSPASR